MDDFDAFYQRKLNLPDNPQVSAYEFESQLQDVSASKIQGGAFSSQDGKLFIDLDNGIIRYNDGVSDIFNLENNSLTVKDANGNTILST